ncbi:alpha/beta hydrolase family protein [Streptomyces somaliensis DSM 40738]|uniref:alpha/beta hydrolase family protein n=1 Tax=Streptomyces somaliensis TaxID=78355 RepID=UPI0021C2CE51|nr:alpha/beta hydrolase family protein [Streptomyces somaliensis]MCQ0022576.1 alpha/beta hydrolase family protein [Streptomyces somaliensis DSM 40738]
MTPTIPPSSPTVWRTSSALAVILVLLATTGWTGPHRVRAAPPDPWSAAAASWRADRIGSRALPDPASPPTTVTAFFASLTPAQRIRLVQRHPLVVGNLAGAPVSLRYLANRQALRRSLAVERARAADRRLSADGRREAARRAHRFSSLLSAGRRILAFDPSGRGRVAEVLGDLERAERVSVIVPGVDTHLLTFEKTARRYTAPHGMAKSLYAAEREAAPGVRTAVIAWADYTSPAGVGVDAATGRLAAEGAMRLVSLIRALPGRSPVSLFCHSYGSVVCGLAARRLPGRVTDIAVAGSPGMRAESAAALGTSARVWAMRDPGDWIADVPYLDVGGLGHGADPVAPGFGARLLSADGAPGHAGYFVPETDSLRNFAEIGVGAYGSVRCAGGTSACRSGIRGAVSAHSAQKSDDAVHFRSSSGGDARAHAAYDEAHG